MKIDSTVEVKFEGQLATIFATYTQGDTEITVKSSFKINAAHPFSVTQLREAPHQIALNMLNKLPITPSETKSQ